MAKPVGPKAVTWLQVVNGSEAAPSPSHAESVRKVDIRLPGKGNSNSHGTRPVY